ncbi:hypothetical protein DICVIV_09962 [Dictyocaulus viviparus]|uniref:Uncharacterized protein n=1 Tax=Dictyocaulus viviparus TaxID=29172 RepID=A0A0D8XNP8_DICVI|nr:hypothetical protein DICVIV_09962 [Dictyocaulus viviparus]
MKIPFLNWIKKSSFSRCSQYFCVGKDVTLNRRKLQICDVARSDVPIEKMSLSRGLAMNKFEKDFMIYPEYTDTDDVRAIQGFTETLKKALELVGIIINNQAIEVVSLWKAKIRFAAPIEEFLKTELWKFAAERLTKMLPRPNR